MYRKQVKYITNFEIHTCPASKTTSQGDVGQVEFFVPLDNSNNLSLKKQVYYNRASCKKENILQN